MRDRELELIAALVEGRLEDETEARALIASAPEYLEEYEAQRVAYQAMRSLGPVVMTELEKAALRRDVWTALRAPSPAATASGTPWYYRWVSVAAGLFVVIGLVAVLGDDDGDDATRQLAVSTTVAGSETAGEGTAEATDAGTTATLASGDDGGAPAPIAEIPSDTLPEGQDLAAPEQAYYQAAAEDVREGELSGVDVSEEPETVTEDALKNCVDEAGLSGYQVVGARSASAASTTGSTLPASLDLDSYIAAIPAGATLADAPVAFVDLVSCVLIHIDD